jgi:hypothetical protein
VEASSTHTAAGWSARRWVLTGLVLILLSASAGIGAYFYGKSTGEDLAAARSKGTEAGQQKGAAEGAEEGYAEGFKEGRATGYDETYAETYRHAYGEAFEDAGLEAPPQVKVSTP